MIINEDNAKKIKELYEAGEPIYKIAEQFNTFPVTIKKALVNLGIQIRGRGPVKTVAAGEANGTPEVSSDKYKTDGKDDLLNASDIPAKEEVQTEVKEPDTVKKVKKEKAQKKTAKKAKQGKPKTRKKKAKKQIKKKTKSNPFKKAAKFFKRISKYIANLKAVKF